MKEIRCMHYQIPSRVDMALQFTNGTLIGTGKRNPASIVESKGISEEDKEYQTELEKHIPKSTRHVFLIRHGQYNLDGPTDTERYLTALGRKQAEYTGNRLKELNFPYTSLIKSTMVRAQETAEVVLSCLEGVPLKKIKDCNLLEEGAPIPPEPPVGHWKPEAYQFYQDGPRIEAAFRKYIHRADVSQTEDSYDIIVSHSNVIRYFVCRALQFPPDAWLRFTLHHCSITWIVITPSGRVIVRGLGDSGHIPSEAVTSN
ncbi:hypothetical protein RUM44_013286 [Polyplax serrata]|uniref:Serine/threonine-protein phosphatase PGAM5, mitochondrial n=1 Tax=Polyplax serrata TaxID=468196 RepID=A0ABR1BHC9_POLSC